MEKGEGFNEECVPDPTACTCPGHRFPHVYHIRACCETPHIDEDEYQKNLLRLPGEQT